MSWKELYEFLKEKGFEVYSIGQHTGKCADFYLVLRNNGTLVSDGTERTDYEILLYCPLGKYSQFESFIEKVKDTMNELFPAVIYTDGEDPHYLDDATESYMTNLIYTCPKVSKINRFT